MKPRLSVLLVEDSAGDAELLVRKLREVYDTVDSARVDTADGLSAALESRDWDAVISDYSLPGFDAPAALKLLQKSGRDIPFLVVSGQVGEGTAVAMMKHGAHDFLLKDQLARLGPAVLREVREAKMRLSRLQGMHDLAASETRYRRLFEAAHDGILILDAATGRIVDVNPYLVGLTGFSYDEFTGKYLWEIGPFKDVAASMRSFAELQSEKYVRYDNLPLLTSDGRNIPVEFVSNVYDVAGTKIIQCNVRDISARKKSEENLRRLETQLYHEQKMAAVGTLAGDVAHEINNPLTGVINFAQLIHDRLPETTADLRGYCLDIIREGERIAAIVRNLLAFSRQDKIEYSAQSPAAVIRGILSIMDKLLAKDQILLVTAIPDDLPLIRCSEPQIQQVLLNLFTNARDALNERYPAYNTDKQLHLEVTGPYQDKDGQYVRITVQDHGNGIPPELQTRVFDQFFTTKDATHGTGLGLSISATIVHEHGGRLGFETRQGEGTSFHLDLPVAADDVCPAGPAFGGNP